MIFHKTTKTDRIIVIVINHYTTNLVKELLENFLSSLPSHPNLRIDWVVTNVLSSEEEKERSDWTEKMKNEIKNKKRNFFHFFEIVNEGFARNVNQSFKLFQKKLLQELNGKLEGNELIFLLNPDTSLFWSNLEKSAQLMDQYPSAKVAGLALINPKGQKEKWGHSTVFPSLKLLFHRKRFSKPSSLEEPNQVAWVSGGAMLIRIKWWEKMKGLDEGFFLYFEDVDFCKRTEEMGGKVFFFPEISVGHRRGGARVSLYRRKQLFYASEARYFFLHRHPTEYLLLRIIRLPYKIYYFFATYFRFSFWKDRLAKARNWFKEEKAKGYPTLIDYREKLQKIYLLKELWFGAVVLNLLILAGSLWGYYKLDSPVILHYNAYLGIDFYGEKTNFFVFPLLAFLVLLLNFFLSLILLLSRKYLKFILINIGSCLAFEIFLAIALFNLILANQS